MLQAVCHAAARRNDIQRRKRRRHCSVSESTKAQLTSPLVSGQRRDLAIFPGIAISLAVFGFSLFGDAVRDELDPKLRSR
jgi:hypothetical protein